MKNLKFNINDVFRSRSNDLWLIVDIENAEYGIQAYKLLDPDKEIRYFSRLGEELIGLESPNDLLYYAGTIDDFIEYLL